MPSDEAVKAAREWLAHAQSEKSCPVSDEQCLGRLLDRMMAQARLEIYEELALPSWECSDYKVWARKRIEEERLAGRGK